MNRKRLYAVGVVIVVILAVFIINMVLKHSSSKTPPAATGNVSSFNGTVSCLPKKGGGQQTTDCAYGLKTAEGKYYAVRVKGKDGKEKDGGLQSFPIGVPLTVKGSLSSTTSQTLNVDGVIVITEIKK